MAESRVYVLKDSTGPPRKPREGMPPPRDPALAATLSLFLWGGGQLYNGQRRIAEWLLLLQILTAGALLLAALSWPTLAGWLDRYFRFDTTLPVLASFFSLAGAIGWIGGTLHAYRVADSRPQERFTGKEREGIAALCSLAVPGWGQYLNGQPRKGAAFQGLVLLEGLAWLTILGVYAGFEHLRRPGNRAMAETALLSAVASLPLLCLTHVVSAYDAFKVARHPGLRQGPWLRLKFAWTRYRTGMNPKLSGRKLPQRVLILILLLVAMDLVAIFYSPRAFYVDLAARLGHHLRSKGMLRTPALLDALRDHLERR